MALSSTPSRCEESDESLEITAGKKQTPPFIVERQTSDDEEKAGRAAPMKSLGPTLPNGPRQILLPLVALLVAIFLVSLDRTIISTAIPVITNEFHSQNDIGWYGSAFFLTGACGQFLVGKVYTFCTPKYVFLSNVLLFMGASALCGAAPDSTAFIVGRAIAGLAAAGMQVGNVIILTPLIPLQDRPKYFGLLGMVMGVSSIIGPLLGGALTSNVSWRWCFYINLPIGGFTLVVILLLLKPNPPVFQNLSLVDKLKKLDLLGEFFIIPGVVSLLLALQHGGSIYSWKDGRIITLFVAFGVCLLAFVLVEVFMQSTATISAKIIKNRTIIAGMLYQFCSTSAMMIMLYYIPEWLQAIKGVSAVQSGIDTLPLVLCMIVASILSGQLISRVGYYTPFGIASAILMSIGAGLMTTWTVDTNAGRWIAYQIIFGLGLGIGMQVAMLGAQTVLGPKDIPIGMVLMFFMQQMGGAIFVSVGINVLDNNLTMRLPPNYHLNILKQGATEFRKTVPPSELPIVLQAYNASIREVLVVGTCMAGLTLVGAVAIEFKSVKDKKKATNGISREAKSS
ncbi:Hypothetical protein R9X50_00648600 [Acrodontium crateriforme]|uniref:Major facilitator superfamily (MFS) profile domain-containing protein n=1 Tax=Acrodontium crateriforme TaxID=150365 RepID=A0AAQ3MA58_9PEZI|nr:Hypothetical protein R9X50_00648600 [Acrodontium crateriforme]